MYINIFVLFIFSILILVYVAFIFPYFSYFDSDTIRTSRLKKAPHSLLSKVTLSDMPFVARQRTRTHFLLTCLGLRLLSRSFA